MEWSEFAYFSDEGLYHLVKPLYSATTGRHWKAISIQVKPEEYDTPYFPEWIRVLYTRLEQGGQINITIRP